MTEEELPEEEVELPTYQCIVLAYTHLNLLFNLFSDINELSLPKTCQVEFPDHDDLLTFKLIISPDEVSP